MIGFSNNKTEAGPELYNLTSPTTIAVGGLPVASDIAGNTMSEIIEKMASAFIAPTFSLFSIGNKTEFESGSTLSGSKTFAFGFSQIANVTRATLEISDSTTNTVLGSNVSILGSAVLPIGTIIVSGNGTVHSWFAKARNTNNIVFSSAQFSVRSYYAQFFGNVTTHPTTSLLVRALPVNNLANVNTFTELISSTKYTIAIPATKALVSVITANNENITSGFIVSNFDVNDANGLAVPYKIYNFTSAVPLNTNAIITLQ